MFTTLSYLILPGRIRNAYFSNFFLDREESEPESQVSLNSHKIRREKLGTELHAFLCAHSAMWLLLRLPVVKWKHDSCNYRVRHEWRYEGFHAQIVYIMFFHVFFAALVNREPEDVSQNTYFESISESVVYGTHSFFLYNVLNSAD